MLRLAAQLCDVDMPAAKPPPFRLGPDATQEEKDKMAADRKAAQREKAIAAAALAFVRNRVSAPRDMSAAAAIEFRAAADKLLAGVY
mmetsp:Transcript_24579/g.53637  ORF Transcript_24579/g.53637 Transcript_24579/m.53637 type:complete len:87 (-) Transcript_24579:242-502(-)